MSGSNVKDFLEELKEQAKSAGSRDDDNEGATYLDPSDGTVYQWDAEKRGWFPKVWIIVWSKVLFFNVFKSYL